MSTHQPPLAEPPTDPGQPEARPLEARDVARIEPWLEHARWWYGEQRSKYDVLGQQALGLLAVQAVLLPLSAPLLAGAAGWHRSLLQAAFAASVLAAGTAVVASRPRSVHEPKMSELVDGFRASLVDEAGGSVADLAEQYWHSHPKSGSPSPIGDLKRAAEDRAWWVFAGVALTSVSIFLTAAAVLIQIPAP